MKTIWKYSIKGARSVSQRAPIVFQDQIIITMNHGQNSNFNGTVTALDFETGAELWRVDQPHYFSQPVLSPDGSIFVTSFDGSAHKISRDGEVLWSTKVSERNLWAGVLHAGKFIFSEIAGGSKFTWALDEQAGAVKWHYEDGGHSYGITGHDPDTVLISSSSGTFDKEVYSLHCVNSGTSERIWKTNYSDVIFQPTILQDLVITGVRGGIAAFNLSDGKMIAKHKSSRDVNFRLQGQVYDEIIILASNQGNLVALKNHKKKKLFRKATSNLQLIWETKLDSEIEYFCLADDYLLVLTESGHCHKINPANGNENEKLELPRYQRGMGVIEVDSNNLIVAVDRHCSRVKV